MNYKWWRYYILRWLFGARYIAIFRIYRAGVAAKDYFLCPCRFEARTDQGIHNCLEQAKTDIAVLYRMNRKDIVTESITRIKGSK